ncbi:outer membrane assembly lipoprotein YfiO [Desulfovibrio sp. X2]|uniref:outer membrane protein assembly factor BamD n=1 Tax=Desulfovibrio sp. X2 TaxID=941449 RepID=UPI000358A585|nr:outer membrane protein assembly factor BamD [Desulfovibrio sp. X2]EPR42230.1 outer membrane assembly lipoprotein YfiO [Desulfovibrio sp. X2]
MVNKHTIRAAALLCLVLLLSGCALIDRYFMEAPADTAQELYENGNEAMQNKKYEDAADYFQKLKDRYPFSPYTLQAELSLGDAWFLAEKYGEASAAYKEYESLHPRSEHIPYVLFQVGVSDYKQFASIDRPQTNINEALEYFYRLKEEHPDTKYAKESDYYIDKCRRFLADHELYVADFYWKNEQYGPAWNRYEFVSQNFKDLPDIVQYAQKMSQLAYFEYQKNRSENERAKEHGSWKQWFDWL